MERYQLRIRPGQSLDDLLAELVAAVWDAISAHPAMRGFAPAEKEPLKADLRKIFSCFIARYDACGLQAICDEAAEPSDWNRDPRPELAPRHPWQSEEVKRLVLQVERGLEEFVDALESAIFRQAFHTPERARVAKSMRPILAHAIRRSIGPYLYRSVSCGMTELCRDAARVDPWG